MNATDIPAPPSALTCELVTLFPEFFTSFLSTSLLGKATAAGTIAFHFTNPRDFAPGKHRSVDDTPYGGGPGMVLAAPPVVAAVEHVVASRGPAHKILLSPQGFRFDQRAAERLATAGRLLFICGRYEGVDERVADLCADEVLSIGDFVLSGGELGAAVIIEAISRLLPGVLGCAASVDDESHASGRLEYPQYTRPPEFRGLAVPDVLLSGDHAKIGAWRRKQSFFRTRVRRPDLLQQVPPTAEELRFATEAAPPPLLTEDAVTLPARGSCP
ncbi:MAG: tRNA (guanosine(37)-N1)-methyltransferase TrmD [Myxococcales bacterium]|nr:tRNA (guanosine(37)-N1)-methyltransferase TrmD [Myxococcales bacterium]